MNTVANPDILPYGAITYPVTAVSRNGDLWHRGNQGLPFGNGRFARSYHYKTYSYYRDEDPGLYAADRKMTQFSTQFLGNQVDLYA